MCPYIKLLIKWTKVNHLTLIWWSQEFWKKVKEEIADQLVYIYNLSIESGIGLQDWKLGDVTSKLKKNAKN